MKYVIVLGDGMADEPIEAAGGKTPLQLADKPVMDEMAKVSEQGIAYTVPSNLPAGSDVANLSMLGYDPQVYYSGRSPLEALSIGVDMKYRKTGKSRCTGGRKGAVFTDALSLYRIDSLRYNQVSKKIVQSYSRRQENT